MTTTPQRYRKKPVEIEAMQWDGTAESAGPIIDWVLTGDGTATYDCDPGAKCSFTSEGHTIGIRTLES